MINLTLVFFFVRFNLPGDLVFFFCCWVGGCDWIRAARWEKKEEEIGGDSHRDLCPSEGTGARGTGDPAGPAASAATAEAESAARARAAGAPRASLPSHLTAGKLRPTLIALSPLIRSRLGR